MTVEVAPSWLITLPTCVSTNTWALSHLQALRHGAGIFTSEQSAGRGRDGKMWHAPAGVLTVSFVLSLSDHVPVTHLALAAGLAVCHVVEDAGASTPAQIKWPNDCYISGRKLAGILCERPAPSSGQVVVGIGLNLNPQWEALPKTKMPAARLADYVTTLPTPVQAIIGLRRYLLEATGLLAAGGWQQLLAQLQTRDYLWGRSITVQSGTATQSGTAAGFDSEGRLLLRTADDQVQTLNSGSVAIAEI
jgi:BirA family biotin operon repressor/biotin-[acetyl-CoA-carboxylase] ligase